jgi:hypothetical protein
MAENSAAVNLPFLGCPSEAQGRVAEHVLVNLGSAIVRGGLVARILPGGLLL